jgi:hypothetical protein
MSLMKLLLGNRAKSVADTICIGFLPQPIYVTPSCHLYFGFLHGVVNGGP